MSTPTSLTRRQVLAGGAAALAAAHAPKLYAAPEGPAARMPVAYVGHGSPMLAVNATRGAEFAAWTGTFRKPVAVLMVSAHFERAPITIGATTPRPLVYDFSNFPKQLYRIKYAAPGAPKLAARVRKLLQPLGATRSDPKRGHDHGTWVPMRWMYAQADVPLLSVSLPTHDPRRLFRIGRALRPLRDEGVLIVGSGSLTHNLRHAQARRSTLRWATDFDAWAEKALVKNDVDALMDWERKAPAARTNHPTVEHFVPLLLASGARHDRDTATFPIRGFDASFSRRCLSLQ